MDAEILFFMTEKDESDFLAYAKKHIDVVDKGEISSRFIIGNCELLFTPSVTEAGVMYSGKFEIRSGNTELNYKDLELAKSTFRKLRNWIKKNYSSRLAYLDKNKKDKLTPSRVHWLGPDAKKWKEADPDNHSLKLSRTSWMEFDIGF